MRRGRSVQPLLAALLTLLAVTSASPQSVIKLPIVAEITGGGASVGAMWRDAVNLAVEEINRKGGILGMKLETSVQDTQTDPPTSVAVMRRVLNDKPFAIFGTVYSSSTVANMDIARQAGVPQFTGSESIIIAQKGNDNIFLTSFTHTSIRRPGSSAVVKKFSCKHARTLAWSHDPTRWTAALRRCTPM